MPPSTTVWQQGPLRLRIFEPPREQHRRPHVHAELGDRKASICIETGEILANAGFTERQLREIVRIVDRHEAAFMAVWRSRHGEE